jgi:cytochrome c553
MNPYFLLMMSTLLLSGCNGGSATNTESTTSTTTSSNTSTVNTSDTDTSSNTTTAQTTLPNYQPAASTGRLLASNCFQCHGTNGTGGFERISGGGASEIYDYAGRTANSDIMAVHGQGYTSTQLSSLIGYLNQVN